MTNNCTSPTQPISLINVSNECVILMKIKILQMNICHMQRLNYLSEENIAENFHQSMREISKQCWLKLSLWCQVLALWGELCTFGSTGTGYDRKLSVNVYPLTNHVSKPCNLLVRDSKSEKPRIMLLHSFSRTVRDWDQAYREKARPKPFLSYLLL